MPRWEDRTVDITGYKRIIRRYNISYAQLARAVDMSEETIASWIKYPDNLLSEKNAETLRRALDIVLKEIDAGITVDGFDVIEDQRRNVCAACKASIDQHINLLINDARSMQKLEEYVRMLYRNLWPSDPAFFEFPAPDRSGVPYIPWEEMTVDQRATVCSDFDAGMQRAAAYQKPHEEATRLHDRAVEVMRLPVRDPDGRTWLEYEERYTATKPSRDVRQLREWVDAFPGDDHDTEEYKQVSAALTLAEIEEEIEEEHQASWRSSVNVEAMDKKALRKWQKQVEKALRERQKQLIDYSSSIEDPSSDDQANTEADQ